jgi:hypothetical protein
MIDENLKEFMNKVDIKNKTIAIYTNKDKGLVYPLSVATLLTRVDYLELTKEELEKAKFERKVDKKDYKMYDCEKLVPKYELTKIEADKFVITSKKVKATHIWNVSNQAGIHQTFENQDEAFKLCEEINNKVLETLKD